MSRQVSCVIACVPEASMCVTVMRQGARAGAEEGRLTALYARTPDLLGAIQNPTIRAPAAIFRDLQLHGFSHAEPDYSSNPLRSRDYA